MITTLIGWDQQKARRRGAVWAALGDSCRLAAGIKASYQERVNLRIARIGYCLRYKSAGLAWERQGGQSPQRHAAFLCKLLGLRFKDSYDNVDTGEQQTV
ncbi:MAG: hypothetical protein RQM92_12075 [Candidatus Syntrophopropionicum ammoniitolerans]